MYNKAPEFHEQSFTCPHCNAFAQMFWYPLLRKGSGGTLTQSAYTLSTCAACNKSGVWLQEQQERNLDGMAALTAIFSDAVLVHPTTILAAPAHEDLPDSCKPDFEEARYIARASPRAAAALLRLCIQKLCISLGEPGKNINEDIGALVKKGLPVRVKEALDIVRVTGNNAVHPGTLTLEDHAAQVTSLFILVNMVVEQMITQPKQIAQLHSNLPDGALAAIQRRDEN